VVNAAILVLYGLVLFLDARIAILIAVATVYGRYHYLVDAVAGLAIAIIVSMRGGPSGRRARFRTGLCFF
jgi:membrane-associated phospholipid phosphatase